MVDTVGKKLSKARMQKKISVEQAARVTKIRPERILDLENDNYSNFPSIAYTKGFLQIYAKYLGVDISSFAETFADVSPLGIDDYEYLSNAPLTKPAFDTRPQKQSTATPFVIAVVAIMIIAFGLYVLNSIQRLGNLDKTAEQDEPRESVSTVAQTTPADVAMKPVPQLAANTIAQPSPAQVSAQPDAAPAPAPVAAASPATSPSASDEPAQAEVILKPLKKTWVIIHKDGENSESIFEDWLYPDAQPLVLRGRTRYWIQLGDKDGVQIQKNGQPIAYQPPGVTIE